MKQALKNITSVRYKRKVFSAEDVFLSPADGKKADVNYYIQVPQNKNGKLSEFFTLLLDLGEDEEKLWNNIYHRTRSEIRSFLNNTEHRHEIHIKPDAERFSRCLEEFNSFAAAKKIRGAETERLSAYNKAGIFAVSELYIGSTLASLHFYRLTAERAANLHAFTLQHKKPELFSPSLFGKAHRSHHWLDILRFKEMGAKYYDFCGWYTGSTDKALLNINKFKETFGGKKVKEYSGFIIHNALLKIMKG